MTCSGECPKMMPGGRRTHCGSCHLTFSGITAFDGHRRFGYCFEPPSVGLILRNGVWGSQMPPEAIARLKASPR